MNVGKIKSVSAACSAHGDEEFRFPKPPMGTKLFHANPACTVHIHRPLNLIVSRPCRLRRVETLGVLLMYGDYFTIAHQLFI